jgi:hypothetical protein
MPARLQQIDQEERWIYATVEATLPWSKVRVLTRKYGMEKPDEVTEQLFEGALELSADERRVFLDRTCSGQLALRRTVEALLEENDRLSGFRSEPLNIGNSDHPAPSPPLPEGTRLGRYLIVEPLGSGGMGCTRQSRVCCPSGVRLKG